VLTLGLVINPLAGVGGPAAMKGSDGVWAQERARELGIVPQATARTRSTFAELARLGSSTPARQLPLCRIITPKGQMGQQAVADFPTGLFDIEILGTPAIPQESTAETTRACVQALAGRVDLLVFVGGDGTARDVLDALSDVAIGRASTAAQNTPVLGIPAGVKMHSGVFATSPGSAAELLMLLIEGGLVAAQRVEVKDIDEELLRRGGVGSVRYGELLVPAIGGYLQHVKSAGKEVEELVLLEIAAELAERFAAQAGANESVAPLVLGPGSTCFALKERLLDAATQKTLQSNLQPTLLGVDVIYNGAMLAKDATAVELVAMQNQHPALQVFVSFSRSQGFLLGRGNQQLSPEFLARLPETALHIVSSRSKLASLDGRPLLADSGSTALDQKFSGLRSIISGYQDHLLYRVQPA